MHPRKKCSFVGTVHNGTHKRKKRITRRNMMRNKNRYQIHIEHLRSIVLQPYQFTYKNTLGSTLMGAFRCLTILVVFLMAFFFLEKSLEKKLPPSSLIGTTTYKAQRIRAIHFIRVGFHVSKIIDSKITEYRIFRVPFVSVREVSERTRSRRPPKGRVLLQRLQLPLVKRILLHRYSENKSHWNDSHQRRKGEELFRAWH